MSTEPPETAEDAEEPGTSAEGTEVSEAAQVSEAEAELAAQRLERERIERRKAERQGPIEAGQAERHGRGSAGRRAGRGERGEAGRRRVRGGRARAAAARSRARAPGSGRGAGPVAPAAGAVEDLRGVLVQGGAPEGIAVQAAGVLGDGGADVLRADPWQLLRVPGVRPEQADGFARALLGAGPDDERRGRAVTVWLLEQAALAGHTVLDMAALVAALGRQKVPEAEEAVQNAIAEGDVLVFQDAVGDAGGAEEDGEPPVRVLVGLERCALAEESLADGLARLVDSVTAQDGAGEEWERAAVSAEGSAGGLIRAVAGHGLVLHTGGEASLAEPAALVRAARGLGLRVWAAAHGPVGRARFAGLVEGTGVATVAGLLSGAEGPGRDADGALDVDLLVVLDAPQLDVETAALVTESLPDGARLVLAGDPGVLWSAGPRAGVRGSAGGAGLPAGRLAAAGSRPAGRAGLGGRSRRAEPGGGARQGGRDRAGAGRRGGRAPDRAAGGGLGAACHRGAGRGDPGDHPGARGCGGHAGTERRAEGTAESRAGALRRVRSG
ncbi:hypothetical protein GCM10023238_09980 [Streptomyces heliomycini]